MPRRDGTGPIGAGPMTGRGFGVCSGVNAGWHGAGFGLRLACRRGFGRFFGRGYAINPNLVNPEYAKSPKEILEMQKDMLQNSLDTINKQLENLNETEK
jgi:hypothetical protein